MFFIHNMNKNLPKNKKNKRWQLGFSYIDVMISVVIFMVGIIAMTEALLFNRMRAQIIERQLEAKQMALSSLESILAAKELRPLDTISGWDTIGNVGSNPVGAVNAGIFESGFRPIRLGAGADGIIGTSDDACTGTGACGSNNSPVVVGLERKIEIEDIPSIDYATVRQRKVRVTVRYLSERKKS